MFVDIKVGHPPYLLTSRDSLEQGRPPYLFTFE